MSDRANVPAERWGLNSHGTGMSTPMHSRQEWRHTVDAISIADAVCRSAPPRPFPPLTVGSATQAVGQPPRPDGGPVPGRHR